MAIEMFVDGWGWGFLHLTFFFSFYLIWALQYMRVQYGLYDLEITTENQNYHKKHYTTGPYWQLLSYWHFTWNIIKFFNIMYAIDQNQSFWHWHLIRKNKYCCQMFNTGHMTVMFKFCLAIMKVKMPAKNKDVASRYSRVIMQTGTDRQIPLKL